MDLSQWLDTILKLEAAHDEDSNFWSNMLGIGELFLGGTTSIINMETVHHTDISFQAIALSGIRVCSGKTMMDKKIPGVETPINLIQPTSVAMEESIRLFEKWNGFDGGRIRYCFCPRYAPSCTTELLKLTAEFSAINDARVHTHAAETKFEEETIIKRTGMREILFLDSVGLITPRTVLAHGVHVNDWEIMVLAKGGAHIAHCPTANLFLADGIAPIPKMLKQGINVGIGADGAPDNTRLDAFREMSLAAIIQKGLHMNPTIQPDAKTLLEMATLFI